MESKFSNLGIVICLVLIIIPSLSWAAEFTDGLIVYLSFDEGKGKTTKDVSGNKNDGTLEGPLKWRTVNLVKPYVLKLVPVLGLRSKVTNK